MKTKATKKVLCNKCLRAIPLKIQKIKKGELEYTYFVCKYCKEVYTAAVTDAELREKIECLAKLTQETYSVSEDATQQEKEEALKKAQEMSEKRKALLEENVRRSDELKELYPLDFGGTK